MCQLPYNEGEGLGAKKKKRASPRSGLTTKHIASYRCNDKDCIITQHQDDYTFPNNCHTHGALIHSIATVTKFGWSKKQVNEIGGGM